MPYFVYLLETQTGSYYCGITDNVTDRLAKHKAGKGAKYTRAFGAKNIVYTEQLQNKSEALKREYEIKRMSKKRKLDLIGKISNAQT